MADTNINASGILSWGLDRAMRIGATGAQVLESAKDGIPFVVVPNDFKVEALKGLIYHEHRDAPTHKHGTVQLQDVASFLAYYMLYHDEDSVVFAHPTEHQATAVLDYHRHGEGGPRWGKHRAVLTMTKTDEWALWTTSNAKKMTQAEFAEFLEDNDVDIIRPDGATMREVATSIKAKTDVSFAGGVTLKNGNAVIKYTEETKAGYGEGNLEIPEEFVIRIPIYLGMQPIELRARLRYRIEASKLSFSYHLLRHKTAQRLAFESVVKEISTATKKDVLIGACG